MRCIENPQDFAGLGNGAETADSIRVPDNFLESFPLGWEGENSLGRDGGLPGWGVRDWVTHMLGWLFTAAAVSLVAPFWFDLLSRVAKLRGTWGRPGGGGGWTHHVSVVTGFEHPVPPYDGTPSPPLPQVTLALTNGRGWYSPAPPQPAHTGHCQ